jgi:predicted lipid-binding transport protein (Tim44 family)
MAIGAFILLIFMPGFCTGNGTERIVGLTVGLIVGSLVGRAVGLMVGLIVGVIVGLAVGRMVGFVVGLEVGLIVGLIVGQHTADAAVTSKTQDTPYSRAPTRESQEYLNTVPAPLSKETSVSL